MVGRGASMVSRDASPRESIQNSVRAVSRRRDYFDTFRIKN